MVKYFKELEKKKEFYLPLMINKYDIKKEYGIREAYVPLNYIEKYADLFRNGEPLIRQYKYFNIEKWCKDQHIISIRDLDLYDPVNYFEYISEHYDYILSEINSLRINSHIVRIYFRLIEEISVLFQDLFPDEKEFYSPIKNKAKEALEELEKYDDIKYSKVEKGEYHLEPDAWYITPNNYLYNPGVFSHQARTLEDSYMRIKDYIESGKRITNYNHSNIYLKETKKVEERDYITRGQFYSYLHYINEPNYLESINGEPVTRERNIFTLIIGIINSHVGFYKFFEDLCLKTDNPKEELEKIKKWTNNDIRDILVRCCGFHKVESTVDKTITTSLINYEEEFKEYIDRGWNIVFVPPIIIDEHDKTVKDYPEEFLKIRKVLKRK